ncbi:hypothetical protein LCI18_003258 [Fusarium solani-melongenae]|uniref:Uncharacterized protein n=1 Tax=Fusarium solani subsp. cucurbitae TaxID=2747967 RepID=A0ACD3YTZ8_FUSSC|nr:hypothetical protein LCI18_003258 [Fusarium solani-melongenae]
MGNVCNGESHQPQEEIELAPRVAQPQEAPVQVQPVPDTEAPRHENFGVPLQAHTNRHVHHDLTTSPSTQRPRTQCQFYSQGYCKHGEACTFLHGSPKEADGEQRSKDNKKSYNFMRELRGAWVEFGPGATATQITLPSDFSAIRISNLPTGCSIQLIQDMLWRAGLNKSRCDIFFNGTTKSTAMVRIWSSSFPKEAWRKLRACTPGFEVVPIPAPLPVGSNFRRVDCRQVQFTWHRPTREVNLTFGTRQAALRLHQGFPAGFTVHGWQVTVHHPAPGDNPGTWVVKLTALPESVRDQDVIQIIPKWYRPFQIQIQYLVYTDDKETESTYVRSMLDEFGSLERWEVSEISDGGQMHGQAVFSEESHARNAAAALDGKRLPFSKSRRLSTVVVTMVTFNVLSRVYNVVQDQINAYKRSWEDQNIDFAAFPPRGSYLTLQLIGNDRESMANAKHELELILAGEVLSQGGKSIWHPSFNNGGDAYESLKTIEEELDAVIIRDGWLSQFRVFGAEGRQTLAEKALDQATKNMVSSHLIPLNQESELRWAVEGGLEEIQSQLGQDKAVFDESSRSILIQGSENDFAKAKLIIARGQAGPSRDPLKKKQSCQICLCEAEEPVKTSCNHAYCGRCFVEMCEAIARNATEFCIVCEGDSGDCGEVLELSEICSLLPSKTFDKILEKSFTSFVQRHQEQFRYCPTPDCSQIYRAASQMEEQPPTFTCNRCLSFICTACHAAHPSLTCAEHRDHTSGGLQALNKLKKKLGVQDCPRCETLLEKIAGCDHITCQACGTHICWVCLATFGDGDACYQHLMAVHKGGEYD